MSQAFRRPIQSAPGAAADRTVFGSRCRLLTLITSFALLNACATPVFPLLGNRGEARSLAVGESESIHFLTRENFDSGIALNEGADYGLDVTYLSNWVDSRIEENESEQALDEKGFDNSVMPLKQAGVTRRSRSHNWFELMLYQPSCRRSSLQGISELDEQAGQYRFTAQCDGKLYLFVNDAPGFYLNNQGYANLTLTRLD